ncbi:MAG: ABC transporter permease [Chloroflexota bacterium]|nr:ABC transporter permease [Chloroflexota bacterium]
MISEPIRDLDHLEPTTGRIPLAAPDVRPLLGWIVPPLVALLIAAVAIEVWVRVAEVSVWVMPRPTGVIENFFADFGRYFNEGLKTLGVSLGGLAIGTAAATLLAAGVAHSQLLERAVLPIAIMVKVTPVVALIPLFIIWFGHGWNPKIAIAALITYFPVLINAIAGFRDVDPRMHDYFRSVDASTWEIFRHLRLPAAVPYLFASLKISVTLSLIGAVVAEFFLSGQGGLGAVIWIEQNNLRLEQVFAAVLMLTLIGVTLSTAVVVAERLFSWRLDQPVTAS